MKKDEFIKKLYDALSGEMSKEEIYSHTQYYSDYIDNEKNNGLNEEEIIDRLGNPRLIAKTILESSGNKKYTEPEYASYEEEQSYGEEKKVSIWKKFKRILITIAVVLVLFTLLRIGFIIFWRIVLPILLIVMLAKWILRFFR